MTTSSRRECTLDLGSQFGWCAPLRYRNDEPRRMTIGSLGGGGLDHGDQRAISHARFPIRFEKLPRSATQSCCYLTRASNDASSVQTMRSPLLAKKSAFWPWLCATITNCHLVQRNKKMRRKPGTRQLILNATS